jgi:uncharacterized NAD(P)/FAD-binding protein YdhS
MGDRLDVEVAVVGGGFSGAMVAAQLLRRASGPLRVALIERRPPPGRGVAYGTPVASHLLNIPATEMSAWSEDLGDFARWVQSRGVQSGPVTGGADYVPRGVYGTYVGEQLAAAVAGAPPDRRLLQLDQEAVGLLPANGRFTLRLASGQTVSAGQVVLAIGQFPPAPLRVAAGSACYVDDPWSPAAMAPLAGGDEAVLVGTGLTAVDVAVAMLEASPLGRVHLVSRRAQLPAAQREGGSYPDWLDPATAPTRVSQLLGLIRREVRAAEGTDWRAVVDALKPHVSALWARLPLVERRRFLRHARSYWEAHRNRLPPPTAAKVARWREEGRLVIHAGRLREVADGQAGTEAVIALRAGGEWHARVARVVNCTGPDTQYRQISHPLVLDLIGTGLARPDPLGLGLDVVPDGRLKDEDGLAGRPLFTLGWPRQGQLWDATTVPSLREQAREVADTVLRGLGHPV